jgi:beta-lactamase regulating signal transducer with metallopeptidase domain
MNLTHIPTIELFSGAVIRIFAVYLLFYVLTRLASRPSVRHILWLVFVIASSCYWITTARQIIHANRAAVSSPEITMTAASDTSPALTTVTVPTVWKWRIESVMTLLGWAYLLGAAAVGMRILLRRFRLRGAIAKAQQTSPELAHIFETECREVGVSRCQILEMPGLGSPGTAYAWNPVVIMPEGIGAFLDDQQLVDVLCHELMHVKRLDFLWNTFAESSGCLLFFHPAMWLALQKLARERELACDRAVIELRHGRAKDYALCLTRLARRQVAAMRFESSNHLTLLDSFLAHRVQALLAERSRRSRTIRVAASAMAIGALGLFAAGWSSLALAVLVEGATPRVIAAVPSIVHRGVVATSTRRRSAPLQPTPSAALATEPEPDHTEALARSSLRPFSPVDPSLDGSDRQYGDSDFVNPTRNDGARTLGDERSPTSRGQNSPSWQKTAADAAAETLGHIAAGKKDHDGDADDRNSRPF